MGALQHLSSGSETALSSQRTIGRDPRCDLHIDDPAVSVWHAELRWDGSMWELHDLGSANGTFVDDRKLEPGGRILLVAGSKIAFGKAHDRYQLIDDTAPCATATGPDGELQLAEAGLLAIPSVEDPRYTIFQEQSAWVAESRDGERQKIASRHSLIIDGKEWRIDLPVLTTRTLPHDQEQLPLHSVALRFLVSRDEEHVELELVHRGRQKRLPARVYWYMLLTLARARLADREKPGMAASEQGWMSTSTLADGLDIEPNLLHQHICRARKVFYEEGVLDFAEVIERRPGALIRIGTSRLEVKSL